MSKLALIGLLGFATAAWAGGWGSSGGDIFKDQQNPWWVSNTTDVTYCVQVDATSVSAPTPKIETEVKAAIDYWRTEFNLKLDLLATSSQADVNKAINAAGIATQDFHEIPCSGIEDLRVQLGYGTLGAEQLAYLVDPGRYLGVAVRTDYDPVLLKGKGFIWIASDIGPHAFDLGEAQPVDRAWSQNGLLYGVLVHEFGHVFGLPHQGFASMLDPDAVMAENFPESSVALSLDLTPFPHFFLPSESYSAITTFDSPALGDYVTAAGSAFFGLSKDCLLVILTKVPRAGAFGVSCESLNPGSFDWNEQSLGSLSFSDFGALSDAAEWIYTTKAQTLFDPMTALDFSEVGAQYVTRIQTIGGVYVDNRGVSQSVYVEASPRFIHLIGSVDGKVQDLLAATSATLSDPAGARRSAIRKLGPSPR